MDAVKDAVEGVKEMALNGKPAAQKKEKKAKPKADETSDSRPLEISPPPIYIDHRIMIFESIKKQYDEEIAQKPRTNINVTLEDGRIEVGQAWVTSPADIARSISKSLFERTVIAKVDDELWDLGRPLEGNCKLALLDFEHPEGKKVFWHSSAHILGEAAERRFDCRLCIGPPLEDGFYYEMGMPDGEVVQPSDHEPLEKIAAKAIKDKQPFERLFLSKEKLLEMFKYNKYKQHIIQDKIPEEGSTVYRNGPMIDLCRGPHVPHTGRIKAFKIMKVR